jgi:hypothetical protein
MKMLWDPPTEIQASGFPLRRPSVWVDSRTVLGGKGSLRRGKHRRALASCAPFCKPESLRRAAPTETRSKAVSSSCERRELGCS